MIGTVSGSWSVFEAAENNLWKCRCRCGEERIKGTHFLKYNKSKGCHLCQRNEEHQFLLETLIGNKVGTWKVLSFEGKTKYGSRRWKCKCDCGKEKTFSTSYLTGNYKKKATTCKACEISTMEKVNRIKNQIPNRFWSKFLYTADKRGKTIEITKEQAFEKFQKQNNKCALTGISLHFTKLTTNYWRYTNASIDRIDSDKQYSLDNIQWVEKRVNMMKQKYTQQEFIELCKLVAQNNSSFKI